MSWLSKFLHPERGYQKGQDELEKYFQQAQGQLSPFITQGNQTYPGLLTAFQSLLNPGGLQDQWAKGYKESASAKQAEGLAQQHGLDAASSMGLLGSTPALQAIQQGTSNIALNDRQNYMNDLMQKYLAGLGLGQNIYGTGVSSAQTGSQNAMNMGQNSAQMAFNKENAQGDLFGRLLGTGASLLGGGLSQRWNPMGSYR